MGLTCLWMGLAHNLIMILTLNSSEVSTFNMDMPMPSTTLFLGDLSIFCQESNIYEFFQSFGPIERVEIKKNDHTGPHLSYAFIKFKFSHSAELALNTMNGALFMGRFVQINWAVDSQFGKFLPMNNERKAKRTAQVHITFNSKNINLLVSETTLRTLFSQFGEIVDVTINKTSFDKVFFPLLPFLNLF
jgi:polyadenylate-binding protein